MGLGLGLIIAPRLVGGGHFFLPLKKFPHPPWKFRLHKQCVDCEVLSNPVDS